MKKICVACSSVVMLLICSSKVEALVIGVKMSAVYETTSYAPLYACITIVFAIITIFVVYDRKK